MLQTEIRSVTEIELVAVVLINTSFYETADGPRYAFYRHTGNPTEANRVMHPMHLLGDEETLYRQDPTTNVA